MTALLDPAVLAKIKPLGLRAQRIAEGLWSGLHSSRLKGASLEFSEHKQYNPGDELRHLDWKVLAKSDRLFVKQFENETNIQAVFVVDTSGSMGYCSGGTPAGGTADSAASLPPGSAAVSKLSYSVSLAAALAWLLKEQQDAVGLAAGAGGLAGYLPPRRGPKQLAQLFERLESLRAGGGSSLAALCRPVLESQSRKTLVAVFTDFLGETEEDWALLRQLRSRGNEVVLFHVLDPFEITFPFNQWSDFEGLEGEAPVQVDPEAQRESYLRRFRAFLEGVERRCVENEIHYVRTTTDEPLDGPLTRYLVSRRNRRT